MRFAVLALSLLPTLAAAQDYTPPVIDPGQSSPFAFAKSGQNTARATAATSAGARVVGGEVAADDAWPWQVALMIAGAPLSPEGRFCGGTMVLDT